MAAGNSHGNSGNSDGGVSQRLRAAIRLNDLALVKRLLERNPTYLYNPDFEDKSNTSLHLAAESGFYDMVEYLISLGHDQTPVQNDIYNTSGLNHGLSLNADGQTPLHVAAAALQTAVVELLCLSFPHTVDRPDRKGQTALLLASKAQLQLRRVGNETLRLLMRSAGTGQVGSRGRGGATVGGSGGAAGGISAVTNVTNPSTTVVEDTSTLEVLLAHGADIAKRDEEGNTVLHNACAFGNLKACRVLLQAGANPLQPNRTGWTPEFYSLTMPAATYFNNLIVEIEKRKTEIRVAAPGTRHAQGQPAKGSVRLVANEDQGDDSDDDDDDDSNDNGDGNSDSTGEENYYEA